MSSGIALGARESAGLGRIYVNLRAGRISQTYSWPKGSPEDVERELDIWKKKGFLPQKTVNTAGEVTHFVAKGYDDIAGYVKEIKWHSKTFSNGGEQNGWNIVIDTTDEVFVLFISTKERPYHRAMNTLLNADFDKPIQFVGFLGEYQGKSQKVLLMAQEVNEAGKPIWLKPMYQERWMSLDLREKIKAGHELSERERGNVAFDANGAPDNTWPYIIQKSDGKWSSDNWDDFLVTKMKEEVIPNVLEAEKRRGSSSTSERQFTGVQGDAYDGDSPSAASMADDDIPF